MEQSIAHNRGAESSPFPIVYVLRVGCGGGGGGRQQGVLFQVFTL
jgi:hypothetical protein